MSVAVRGKRGPVRPDSLHVQRGQATRRRILESARRRILADGFEALRLDDLAADAGITKPAVIKSVGGKAAILLALSEEDRATRVEVMREHHSHRTGLRRRLHDVVRECLALDVPRLRLVQACFGYVWFWTGDEHERSQSNIDEMRELLSTLIESASAKPLSAEQTKRIALRLVAGYVIAVRDLCYARSDFDGAVRTAVDFALG